MEHLSACSLRIARKCKARFKYLANTSAYFAGTSVAKKKKFYVGDKRQQAASERDFNVPCGSDASMACPNLDTCELNSGDWTPMD